MAILGYKDILQYSVGGASGIWATRSVSVLGGSAGAPVANAPVTNLLDPNLGKVFQRTNVGTGTVSIRIDLTALGTGSEPLLRFGVIGLLGLRAIPFAPTQGYDYDLNVRVRDFLTIDRTLTYYGFESAGQWPRQLWFSSFIVGTTEDPDAGRECGRSGGGTAGITIDITENMATSTTYTLEIGRIVLMNCITGRFEPSPTLQFEEAGELQRSFSGSPYNLAAPRLRRMGGSLIALPDQSVYGHSLNEPQNDAFSWISSMTRVSREAGRRGEVVLIPQEYLTGSNNIGGRLYYPSAWQTRPIFGQLDDGITLTRQTTTSALPAPGTQVNALWDASFSITETPTR